MAWFVKKSVTFEVERRDLFLSEDYIDTWHSAASSNADARFPVLSWVLLGWEWCCYYAVRETHEPLVLTPASAASSSNSSNSSSRKINNDDSCTRGINNGNSSIKGSPNNSSSSSSCSNSSSSNSRRNSSNNSSTRPMAGGGRADGGRSFSGKPLGAAASPAAAAAARPAAAAARLAAGFASESSSCIRTGTNSQVISGSQTGSSKASSSDTI
ncbi:hypothetical protein ACSSS7_007862 [Eimeria intestinalis]